MATVKYLDENGLATVWNKVKGIVTPKADKVSGATAGHLAGLNSSGNLTDSGLVAANVAQKDGSYSGMTVGAAEDLVSAESVASEFTSRITGGSTAVGKGGTALVDKIKGRTLVWNQLVNGETQNGVTVDTSVTTENKYIDMIDGSSSSRMLTFPNGGSVPEGHKALVLFIIKSDYDNAPYLRYLRDGSNYSNIIISGYTPNVWQISYTIIENGFIAHSSTCIIPYGSNHVQGKYISTPLSGGLKVFDLTLMFGSGKEPTVEEFKALYPGLDYDYNPGTLISNAATAIETVGFNLLNDDFEQGVINAGSGANEANAGWIRTRTFSSVIPGSSCFCKRPSGSTALYLYFYDESGSYLGVGEQIVIGATGTIFTVPQAAKYVRATTNLTSYTNDICINISDPSRNGTYEPYWRSELDLNIPTLTGKLNGTGNSVVIFPNGLRSAGTVYDEIVGNKAIKRIGAVDMGSLTWTYAESNARFYSSVLPVAATTGYNCICTKYLGSSASDLAIFLGNNNRVYAYDSAYTDAATFKASLADVPLYYELATPEEYILDEAIPTAMRNDPYGTERRLPEDTAAIVTAPFRADITYSTNIKEAVQSLPQNYINVNSMQDFIAELGTLMGGTWTMRPADGKFDFTFTPNPSNE